MVGPEAPLNLGLADRFAAAGLTVCGASQKAALIEGSKAFSKELMAKYGIPTGEFRTFTDRDEAARYLKDRGAPICVKADGLAAGKGVIPAQTLEQALAALDLIMVKKAFGAAGHKVVIEEFLTGEEASFLAFSDGEHVIPLPTSQDHKPIFDHDQGPNTGGMGAYSPAPVVTPALHDKIMAEVMAPTIRALAMEGRPYQGVLYAGLMIKNDQIQVLEFNARFGDPEAQPLLMRMDSDLAEVLLACVKGGLDKIAPPLWSPEPTVCVVMASGGYPGSYEKGKVIHGLEEVAQHGQRQGFPRRHRPGQWPLYHRQGPGPGGHRPGSDIPGAIKRAYQATRKITWEGVQYRSDIGKKALTR